MDTSQTVMHTFGELFDPTNRANPYPLYARLRAAGPTWVEPMSAVVVPGYRDCAALLRDPRLSAERGTPPAGRERAGAAPRRAVIGAPAMVSVAGSA
jgi:cytochrome P450